MIDEFSWLVGLVEGEGCFSLHTSKEGSKGIVFTLGTIDDDVAERVVRSLNAKSYSRQLSSGKTFYIVKLHGKRAEVFALLLYPFLCARRKQQIADVLSQITSKSFAKLCKLAC